MDNKGLEALAALASAAPAPADNKNDDNASQRSNNNNGGRAVDGVDSGQGGAVEANNRNVSSLNTTVSNGSNGAHSSLNVNQLIQQLASNQSLLSPANLAILSRLQQQQQQQQTSNNNLVQQMNLINQVLQQQQQQQQQQQKQASQTALASLGAVTPQQFLQLALSGHPSVTSLLQSAATNTGTTQARSRHVVPNGGQTVTGSTATGATKKMPPPKAPTAGSPQQNAVIAPQPSFDTQPPAYESGPHDKRQLKRAANRRSAQLSRKRKKQFIEELREENDDLRRKEQILRAIPDLVVVFDSSGRLWFVSESVSRFLQFNPHELEGSSFWDRLCVDSVRLLKAAFMDSLAARKSDSDTAPLGNGVWELRLVDKDGSQKIVTLNGVVHFAGERPECVCSIRPREELPSSSDEEPQSTSKDESAEPSSRSDDSSGSFSRYRVPVKPQQSVVSTGSSRAAAEPPQKKVRIKNGKRAMRISDSNSGNSSMEDESGNSD